MTTGQKLGAAAGLVVITGAMIALHDATVANGEVLGLTPMAALGLVAIAAFVVPKLMASR